MTTTYGGLELRLQAAIDKAPYGYDAPAAVYDVNPNVVYGHAESPGMWSDFECLATSVQCGHGGRLDQIPGVRASVGTLSANLYDAARELDPSHSMFPGLAYPGRPVRVVLIGGPAGTYPLWIGLLDSFVHDLLTGEGTLDAADVIARFTGVTLADVERPAETSRQRYANFVGMLAPAPAYMYEGADKYLPPAKFSGDLWSAGICSTAESEQSCVWVDRKGVVHRAPTLGSAAPRLTASDCEYDTADLIYGHLSSTFDDDLLANVVKAERVGYEGNRKPRMRASNASLTKYPTRTLTRTSVAAVDDTALYAWMDAVLSLRALPEDTITGMRVTIPADVVDGDASTNVFPWAARTAPILASLSVGQVLRVRLTSRGEPHLWTAVVAGIHHSLTPDSWECEIALADGPATGLLAEEE